MPVSDRREIRFDAAAMSAVLVCSPRMMQAAGLPRHGPKEARFEPSTGAVILTYGDRKQTMVLQTTALGALLIGYCMRAGIRIPRRLSRSVRVDRDAVVLVLSTHYPNLPPTLLPERTEDANLPGSRSWLQLAP